MYSLILKDIMIQKKTVLFSLLYVVFFIFAFQHMGSAGIASAVVAVTYILVQTACAYEDKNKTDMILNSLPIGKGDIVLSKYLSVYVYALLGAAAYMAAGALFKVTGLPVRVYDITMETAVGALFAVTLLSSLYFPIYFKLGYIKSRIFNTIMFFLFFFGITSLMAIVEENKNTFPWVVRMADLLKDASDIEIAMIIIAAALILQVFSYILSLKFYKAREF